jgi:hypothetical protein
MFDGLVFQPFDFDAAMRGGWADIDSRRGALHAEAAGSAWDAFEHFFGAVESILERGFILQAVEYDIDGGVDFLLHDFAHCGAQRWDSEDEGAQSLGVDVEFFSGLGDVAVDFEQEFTERFGVEELFAHSFNSVAALTQAGVGAALTKSKRFGGAGLFPGFAGGVRLEAGSARFTIWPGA